MIGAAAAGGSLALLWLLSRKKRSGRTRRQGYVRNHCPRPAARRPKSAEPAEPPSSDLFVEEALPRFDRIAEIHALLQRLVFDEPTPGGFYQVQPGDTLPSVIARALDRVIAHPERARPIYMTCAQSGKWNLARYGSPSVTKKFPRAWLVPGLGLGIAAAFYPINEDALSLLLEGRSPRRAIDERGKPLGTGDSLGLIWLPPVEPKSLAAGEPTCAPYRWADDSSTIDPPPELLSLLEAA